LVKEAFSKGGDEMRRVNWWTAYLLVLGVFSIGAGELFLRLTWSDPSDRYYVWPPHTRNQFHPAPKHLPGVSPATIIFETNSLGLRGREPSQA
jgi:hypothetical protein